MPFEDPDSRDVEREEHVDGAEDGRDGSGVVVPACVLEGEVGGGEEDDEDEGEGKDVVVPGHCGLCRRVES